MSKTNKKPADFRKDFGTQLAGGFGATAAKQDAEALLRRSVMSCLLWENLHYENGVETAANIQSLIPKVSPTTVKDIAIEARNVQKLRHVPLFIASTMAHLGGEYRKQLGVLLPEIIQRPDELTEFLSLYWLEKKQPLAKQVKIGLATAFKKFNAYQLAKYNRDEAVKLRDVMFLTHPHPDNQEQEILFKQVAENTLATPDTWEVALSTGKDKKTTWERLINEGKLGALAFLRNLRNMTDVNVSKEIIRNGFSNINPRWLLPINYITAARYAPTWIREIETLMLKGLATAPKLAGHTVLVVDVSGSMGNPISDKSGMTRLDVAIAMAILASEMCESISIYATAGNDSARKHATKVVPAYHGFGLSETIHNIARTLGGGGIFTRQCLEYIKPLEQNVDRIVVFSDSQDCDVPGSAVPAPFGKYNYIVDVSAHQHGINYKGVWTAEISGWSEQFLTYILGFEGNQISQQDEEESIQQENKQ